MSDENRKGLNSESPTPDVLGEDDETLSGAMAVFEALANAAPGEPAPVDDRQLADLPLNDWGNAHRLLARHGHDLVVLEELHRDMRDGWASWDGRVWRQQGAWKRAQKLAHQVSRSIIEEARALERDPPPDVGDFDSETEFKAAQKKRRERISRHFAWAVQSGNSSRVASMLQMASPYLLRSEKDFNADPNLLTLESTTLRLLPDGGHRCDAHDRQDLSTYLVPVTYDAGADCPRFRTFLGQVQPQAEIRAYIQRVAGYCLTGLVGEQVIFCWYGRGANGKSTLLSIFRHVLGDYTVTLPFSTFAQDKFKSGGDATPDLVRLVDKRLALASEPESGTKLSESSIKTQAGGEPITVRPLHGAQFEFDPTHKIILSFNNPPKIQGQDHGTWRRIQVLPWPVQVPEEAKDTQLAERILEEEATGIFNWMLEGYRLYREQGLAPPDVVTQASEEYRAENDPLADFFKDVVIAGDEAKGHSITSADFFEAYAEWAKANGREPVSNTRFGLCLRDRGVKKARSSKTGRQEYQEVTLNFRQLDRIVGRSGLDPADY
ncbi:DNA primase family protein [Fodinicurvata fenggangensis]|uniref:DNA primase family protein n=1 Tax=Fodinicurvata fenggangensis TaxID=1121830 RepID=UPI00068DEF90|nr:phage/plasmid primase, P4 family [Fodinicurvata fenggangensis]